MNTCVLSVFCVERLNPSQNDGNCWGIWGIWGGGGDWGRGKWTSIVYLLSIICIYPKMQIFLYFPYCTSLVFVVSSLHLFENLDMISFVWVHWDYLLELQVQWQALWIVKLVTPSSQQFMEPVSHVCRGDPVSDRRLLMGSKSWIDSNS